MTSVRSLARPARWPAPIKQGFAPRFAPERCCAEASDLERPPIVPFEIVAAGQIAHDESMLSQKTRYAIRAMQHLADAYGRGPVQLTEIADKQNIPPKFLTVILSELTRFGIVDSQRGKDGGYWLAISPIDITYGDLIRHMRGSLALVPCASRFAHEKCKNCLEEGDCRTRALMLQVRDSTAALLDSISLADPIELVAAFEESSDPVG